jgi:Regulator of chromosome condensation (RCC1) repeat
VQSIAASTVHPEARLRTSRRSSVRLLRLAPAALLIGGLFAVWAGPLARPAAATGLAGFDPGTVVAWGDNTYGQTNVPTGLSGVTGISAGWYHSLGLKSDGTVVAWGYNDLGQTDVPASLSGVTAIAAGGFHNLALRSDGTVVAWGWNGEGQTAVPAGLTGVTAIAAGDGDSFALKSGGAVVAWGDNYYGETNVPAGLSGVTAIAAGDEHTLALKSNGTVVAWGDDSEGETDVPPGLSGVTAIAAGYHFSLALKSNGTVVAWGWDSVGQTAAPAGLTGVTAIAAGGAHSLALRSDGTVVAWGLDYSGDSDVPAGLPGVIAIAAGGTHSLALVPATLPSSGATYHAITPTRVLDTRNGTGGLSGPFTNHAARTFTVAGVPAGATAVTGNLTVTGQTSSGYLYIGPVATNNPGSSTLNFPVGDDRANAVTVQLGAGGTLSITFVAPSNGPTANAIFDVTGYFTPDTSGATYHALTPTRALDTRNGTGGLSGPFTNHAARTFTVSGVPSGATAVTGNLTVTGQTSGGYLYIGPVATNNPGSSTLNFPVGDDRANAVTVQLGSGGTLSITFVAPSNGPSAQAIFDVTGYFTPDMSGAVYVPLSPTRDLDTRNGTGGLSGPFTNHAARTFTVAGAPSNATAVTGNLTVTGQTSSGYLFIGPTGTNNPTSSTLNFPVGDDRANAVAVQLGTGGTLSITFVAPSNGPTAQGIFDLTGYFVPSGG